jgi:hypothetical protein
MRGATFIVPFLAFLVIVPTWAGEKKHPRPSRSIADDLRELTKGKGEWRGSPIKIKRELMGKVEQVIPALAFVPLDKGAKTEDDFFLIVGVEVSCGITFGPLHDTFKLVEKGSKRFIVIGEGDKQVALSYSLQDGKLKLTADKKIRVKGEGEIDYSGDWTRKN